MENILDNINLQITPGEKVCIITGPERKWKNTLISLLAACIQTRQDLLHTTGLPAEAIDTESLQETR